jgi:hypothetical protein
MVRRLDPAGTAGREQNPRTTVQSSRKEFAMLRFGIIARVLASSVASALMAIAAGFSFNIGSPVASQDFVSKSAAFVFRTEGCADPAKPQISGTAEGLVNGMRRSVALILVKTSKPGVYAVNQNWPREGGWVVALKGTCGGANAGAIVPIGPNGFVRESAEFFPRAATNAEIEASLKVLPQGGKK